MKVKLLLVAALVIGVVVFTRFRAVETEVDAVLLEALTKTGEWESFRAISVDFDKSGAKLATVEYLIEGKPPDWSWLMSLGDDRQRVLAEWVKMPGWLYVLDTADGKYWQTRDNGQVELASRIDVRQTAAGLLPKIGDGRVEVVSFGSEPCLLGICRRFKIVNPSDTELDYYLWIDQEKKEIVKDQYLLGNGQTSMTTYRKLVESEMVELPEVKPAPEGADVMMLPGSIRIEGFLSGSSNEL